MLKNQAKICAILLSTTILTLNSNTHKALALPYKTSYQPQLQGLNGFQSDAIFTVGETLNNTSQGNYTPPGILDGIGAIQKDANTVRIFVNHELRPDVGYGFNLENGTNIPAGSRISYFDINRNDRTIVDGGLAISNIYDRQGNKVTDITQLEFEALARFCSSILVEPNMFGNNKGFVDALYFAGEETGNGTQWVLDVNGSLNSNEGKGDLWAAPMMGRGAWENWTPIDTGTTNKIAMLGGDDSAGAPLFLYVGTKNALGDGSILDRNGLAEGILYSWKPNDITKDNPEDFNGTGNSLEGSWVALNNFDPTNANQPGYDDQGYADQETLWTEAFDLEAFSFSRPEDLATNPLDGTQAVFASTGRSSLYPSDSWGTTYLIDLDFDTNGNPLTGLLKIIYDGDDIGNRDFGLRSPDNLDWGDDGYIYVQEDRSIGEFGDTSGEEASIFRLSLSGELTRIAQMNRSVVAPNGVTDSDPTDIGEWESSGILDVTQLFNTQLGEKLFITDVQAHSLTDGIIADQNLVQGGQLIFLSQNSLNPQATPEPSNFISLFSIGILGFSRFCLSKIQKKN
jgi:hypothetical protein